MAAAETRKFDFTCCDIEPAIFGKFQGYMSSVFVLTSYFIARSSQHRAIYSGSRRQLLDTRLRLVEYILPLSSRRQVIHASRNSMPQAGQVVCRLGDLEYL